VHPHRLGGLHAGGDAAERVLEGLSLGRLPLAASLVLGLVLVIVLDSGNSASKQHF